MNLVEEAEPLRLIEERIPDDIIAGMLYYLQEIEEEIEGEGKEAVPMRFNTNRIHKTIESAKTEFPELLNPFVFSYKRRDPYSPMLAGVIARLELSRIITIENPEYDQFIVKRSARKYIEQNILPLFDRTERAQLKKMAGKFFKEIKVKSVAV